MDDDEFIDDVAARAKIMIEVLASRRAGQRRAANQARFRIPGPADR